LEDPAALRRSRHASFLLFFLGGEGGVGVCFSLLLQLLELGGGSFSGSFLSDLPPAWL
jgi:hypothetical protein